MPGLQVSVLMKWAEASLSTIRLVRVRPALDLDKWSLTLIDDPDRVEHSGQSGDELAVLYR